MTIGMLRARLLEIENGSTALLEDEYKRISFVKNLYQIFEAPRNEQFLQESVHCFQAVHPLLSSKRNSLKQEIRGAWIELARVSCRCSRWRQR